MSERSATRRGVDFAPIDRMGDHVVDVADDVLERFAVDLTAQARAGALDPVVGREEEVRQLADILSRRRQNNPLLVGEAGVGKTAVVEGFALAVVQREVPQHLEGIDVLALDLGLLQAGATLEGEFEERLAQVLDAVRGAQRRIVLFLDEVHMLIGAGGAAGTGDAANLLKPALARGEVSVIAATTWREYKVHIEPDPALTRRFQPVVVDEPARDAAVAMLRKVARGLELHHGVRVLDEAVEGAVDLSTRYVAGRKLPDKAISVLDTACARVRIAQSSTPGDVERAARAITWIDDARVALERDRERHGASPELDARLGELGERARQAEARLESLEGRWQTERGIVRRIEAVREELRRGDRNVEVDQAPAPHLQRRLATLEAQLGEAQADGRLVPLDVDRQAVAEVVEAWTKIPVARQRTDDAPLIADLERHLARFIVGQDRALCTVARRLRSARAGLEDAGRPAGVFLLLGPPGTGKTETAHVLADLLYGGRDNLVGLDMAEFREAHTLSKLRGAPPGYVGHGRGGQLTEAVRRRPYSVVLLDDVDRAHPDVLAAFLPTFDRGRMEDGEGTAVDFRHALIVMTSNLDFEAAKQRLGRPVLDRATVVRFDPLDADALTRIFERAFAAVVQRFARQHGVRPAVAPGAARQLAQRVLDGELAGRGVQRIVSDELLPELAAVALALPPSGRRSGTVSTKTSIQIDVATGGRIEVSYETI